MGNDTENDRGLLLHYQSGTWTTVAPPTVSTGWWELAAVHFTSADEGWAVGNNISEDRAGSAPLPQRDLDAGHSPRL